MEKVIVFNKTGYDPFIDFIKAYSIVCVLIAHTFPFLHETGYPLYYGMAVPLFILIQAFHVFKKESYTFNIKKVIHRVLLPFLIIQIGPLCYQLFNPITDNDLVIKHIYGGGYGPGSYFPWLYLQLAIILAFVKTWFENGSKCRNLTISLIICEGFEILLSLIGFPDWLYRLLPIRYFFLIYLGWIWAKEGIILNVKTILISLLSILSIVYFEYYYTPTEPWFYDTSWKCHRWPCYFYVSTLLSGILYWIYNKVRNNKTIQSITRILAKCSYEIFLIQMIAVPYMPQIHINSTYLGFAIRIVLIYIVSIVGGYYYNALYNNFLKRIS